MTMWVGNVLTDDRGEAVGRIEYDDVFGWIAYRGHKTVGDASTATEARKMVMCAANAETASPERKESMSDETNRVQWTKPFAPVVVQSRPASLAGLASAAVADEALDR